MHYYIELFVHTNGPYLEKRLADKSKNAIEMKCLFLSIFFVSETQLLIHSKI